MSRSWGIKKYYLAQPDTFICDWFLFVRPNVEYIWQRNKTLQHFWVELHKAAEIVVLAAAWVHTFLGVKQTMFWQTSANSVNPANKSGIFSLSQIQHHSCTYDPLKSTFKQILLLNLGRASHHASQSTKGGQASQAVIRLLISPQKKSVVCIYTGCVICQVRQLRPVPGTPATGWWQLAPSCRIAESPLNETHRDFCYYFIQERWWGEPLPTLKHCGCVEDQPPSPPFPHHAMGRGKDRDSSCSGFPSHAKTYPSHNFWRTKLYMSASSLCSANSLLNVAHRVYATH